MSSFLFTLFNPSDDILKILNKIEGTYIASCGEGYNVIVYKEILKTSSKRLYKKFDLKTESESIKIEPVHLRKREGMLSNMRGCNFFVESGEKKESHVKRAEIQIQRDDTPYCSTCNNFRVKSEFSCMKNGKLKKTCDRCSLRIKQLK